MIAAMAAAVLCLMVAAVSWLSKMADAGQTPSPTWLCGQRESIKEETNTKNHICVFPSRGVTVCGCVCVTVTERGEH